MSSYRLRNSKDAQKTLGVSYRAWFEILDLAEKFGWNPMGTVVPDGWIEAGFSLPAWSMYDPDTWPGTYTPEGERVVLIEDALNLADALDRAFIDYEPQFVDWITARNFGDPFCDGKPGIGAVLAIVDFCREGAFVIEKKRFDRFVPNY